jgi:hypothetical protein
MAQGCPEQFDRTFLKWIWRWPRDSRPRVIAALEKAAGQVHVLRRPSEVARFLEESH